MRPLCRDDLMSHRPRLIARSDQRRRAEGFSPRPNLVPEVLADDTLALAERLLGGTTEPRWAAWHPGSTRASNS
jgi:hypothetical protein